MRDSDLRNLEINEQTKNVMVGVVSGAIIGLATASIAYQMKMKKKKEEQERREMLIAILKNINEAIILDGDDEIHSSEGFYCECDTDNANTCACDGECYCHYQDDEMDY